MAIDILNIKPNVISRDLTGKYVLLYGKPKSGKTTAACQFPKTLLCAFEKGYNAIGGVMAADINKWSDFKAVLRQLNSDAAKEIYKTIVIDTVTIAYEMCEKHVCVQNGVQKIGDIPYGGGYTAAKTEFQDSLREITRMGYGVVLIAHSNSRIEKTADGSELEIIGPELPKRAAEICNGLVDIIGYIGNEYKDGEYHRYLYTRETPVLFAGSRFKYLAPKIPFGYSELVDAIAEAIDKAAALDGAVVTTEPIKTIPTEVLDFKTVQAEAKQLWTSLLEKDQNNAPILLKKIEMIFGHKIKLSEVQEDQVDLLQEMVLTMREM